MAERFGSDQKGSPKFRDVDRLENSDGIVCVISQRRTSGVLTFGIWREFKLDGQVERTQFIPEFMAPRYAEMVQQAIERMAQLRADPQALPFPVAPDHEPRQIRG